MPHPPQPTHPTPRFDLAALIAFWILVVRGGAVYCIVNGTGIIVSGADRMPEPTYTTVLHWAPPWVWGGTIALAGAWMLAPWKSLQAAGYVIAATWNLAFAAAFLVAYATEGGAWTAWIAYAFIAFLWVLAALATAAHNQAPSHRLAEVPPRE